MRVLEAFWTRFGVDEDKLASWPVQRVKDYLTVMRLEHEHANTKQNVPGGGSTESATELAFKKMKQEASSANPPPESVGPHPDAATRAERAKLFE